MNRIDQILEMGANVTLSVTADDLKEFSRFLINETKRELERAIIDDKAELYLTAEEVAEKYGVSVGTVWRWGRSGYIQKYTLGTKIKFSSREIKEKFKTTNHEKNSSKK